jgi:glycosyltransferase involved in cell wall biosynthesis
MVEKLFDLNPLLILFNNHQFWRLKRNTSSNTIKILYILHPYRGGTEQHVMNLVKGLNPDKFQCYILKPKYLGFELIEQKGKSQNHYFFQNGYRWNISNFYSKANNRFLGKLLIELQIDIIHIQHLIAHSLDIFDVAEERKIPVILTIHDYYLICPRIYLVNQNDNYCTNYDNFGQCNICLSEMGLKDGFCIEWRQQFSKILNKCAYVIAPSGSVFEKLAGYYSIKSKNMRIIEHGVDESLITIQKNCNSEKSIEDKPSVNIAFIGILLPHKGEKIFLELAKSSYIKQVNWHIIGYCSKLTRPGFYPEENVNVSGKFGSVQELIKIVNSLEIDLTVFPSICPETYSYVLSESWICGVPAIASNIGALEERIRIVQGGWTTMPDLDHFRDKINDILSHPQEYNLIQKNLKNIKLTSNKEMLGNYEKLYLDVVS